MDFSVGDIVQMKKSHPCGSSQWEILRTGIDFRIKCCGCGHMVMLPRVKFEKNVKKIISSGTLSQSLQGELVKASSLRENGCAAALILAVLISP